MSVALFIVPEREVEGLETFVNGKALGHSDHLDQLAQRAGVRPLMEFFSPDPAELGALLDEEGLDLPAADPSTERWFSAADGLASVRGLLSLLTADPSAVPDGPALIDDLREFESVLDRLASEGVRWHLAIDL
jgi:hypothetical protein